MLIKQTKYNLLISELYRCLRAEFVSVEQSRASCFHSVCSAYCHLVVAWYESE